MTGERIMEHSATSVVIDSETGKKWVYGVEEGMVAPPAAPQQEYTLLQLEVLSGLALKYAARQLHLPSAWAA